MNSEYVKIPVHGGLTDCRVDIADGRFVAVEPTTRKGRHIMLPGFVDVHTHGADMIDVNHITGWDDVNRLSLFYASHGVTTVLLSVMTDTRERMLELVSVIAQALEKPVEGAQIAGIHLEGPFLSLEYKGAMPASLVLKGDCGFFDQLVRAGGGRIRYVTLAPEVEGVMDLIRHIRKNHRRIVISMGHSSAEYETAVQAVEEGVTSATHLFNAMKLFHMHRPAISGAALERDEVMCEIIADGFHLHPATIRLIAKTKGWNRIVAVSDSIMATGLPAGSYKLGVNDVIVGADGDAKLPDGVRAGSTLTLDRAYRNLIRFTGANPCNISRALSGNACRMLHLNDRGVIEIRKRADYVLLDKSGEIVKTVVAGKPVYCKGD